MSTWPLWMIAIVAGALAFAVLPAAFAWLLSTALGPRLSGLMTAMRLYGEDPTPPHLLAFVGWLDPGVAAMLLSLEPDDVAAGVLGKLSPRFVRKVLAELPALRRDSLEYWLDHPQPFPRASQQAVARRFKRALERAERLEA